MAQWFLEIQEESLLQMFHRATSASKTKGKVRQIWTGSVNCKVPLLVLMLMLMWWLLCRHRRSLRIHSSWPKRWVVCLLRLGLYEPFHLASAPVLRKWRFREKIQHNSIQQLHCWENTQCRRTEIRSKYSLKTSLLASLWGIDCAPKIHCKMHQPGVYSIDTVATWARSPHTNQTLSCWSCSHISQTFCE